MLTCTSPPPELVPRSYASLLHSSSCYVIAICTGVPNRYDADRTQVAEATPQIATDFLPSRQEKIAVSPARHSLAGATLPAGGAATAGAISAGAAASRTKEAARII